MANLVRLCDDNDLDIEMMEFVERESGFLIAMARQIVDERKARRTSEQDAVDLWGKDLEGQASDKVESARLAGLTCEQFEKAAKANGLMEEAV